MEKKKDFLESFIKDNLDSFNSEEPSLNVWDNIKEELDKGTKKINYLNVILKVAAVFIIFFSAWISRGVFDNANPVISSTEPKDSVWTEFVETENYFKIQVAGKMDQIDRIKNVDPEIIKEIKTEMEFLDKEYSSLRKDLSENIDRTEIIEAMIVNYRIKLEVLEDFLREIKNNENYETNKNI